MPIRNGLILHALYETREINDPKHLFSGIPQTQPEPDMGALATQLIDRQIRPGRHRGPLRGAAAPGERGQARGRVPESGTKAQIGWHGDRPYGRAEEETRQVWEFEIG